ncbi:MAG: ABC transporter ATP-binding protein [Rhodoferax sp.]|jgi:branched-chain amino acid transport system ATP-binding protein
MSALVLKGVGKRFGGLQAVTPFDMEIARGKITGLIGPNGAGKTTVVNLITGVYKLSSGTIKFGDKDLTEAPRHEVARAGLARTFQTIRLLPDATVVANVMIGMYRHQKASLLSQLFGLPSSRAETRRFRDEVYQLLDRFGMTKYAEYPAGALSYGDQRRVEMMRALALKPEVLLLDEPVAGINEVEAAKLGEIFRKLATEGEGMAVLLIEHNMRFVTSLCDYVYVLDSGILISQGSAEKVVNDPVVVKAYLGDDDDA